MFDLCVHICPFFACPQRHLALAECGMPIMEPTLHEGHPSYRFRLQRVRLLAFTRINRGYSIAKPAYDTALAPLRSAQSTNTPGLSSPLIETLLIVAYAVGATARQSSTCA